MLQNMSATSHLENQTLTSVTLQNQTADLYSENLTIAMKNIVVTVDFGQKLILDVELENSAGMSALDALKKVADVETIYGGGFVSSIEGISSKYSGIGGAKQDWLYYVNGIMANVGSGGYILHDGDVEHWDYHNWRHYPPTATVGLFPEPFLHGYDGKVWRTVVLYEGNLIEEAELIAEALIEFGVEEVSIMRADELTDDVRCSSNLIILGTKDSAIISELNELRDKLGFYVYFDEEEMVTLNVNGTVARKSTVGGVVQATQNPWNPKGSRACENVVWMIAGVGEEDVRSAVKLLTENHSGLRYAFALAVVGEEICRVPIC